MILYELIAGDVPFGGITPMQVVLSHIQAPPPPLRTRRPDLPHAVEIVVQRALAKDPTARFAHAGDVAQALVTAWNPASTATAAAQLDIHQQATREWHPPSPTLPPTPSGAPVSVSGSDARFSALRPLSARLVHQVASAQRQVGGGLLPLLGGLLALLLLGGMLLAWRGERSASAVRIGAAGAAVTAVPVSRATTAPATPSPAAPPPAGAADSIADLRTLLTTGAADGRAGTAGQELLTRLERTQQAVTAGNAPAASQQLFAMQKILLQGVRAGTIERAFARQVFGGIETIATADHLTLPLSVKLDN